MLMWDASTYETEKMPDGGSGQAYQGGTDSFVDWISMKRESMSLSLSCLVLSEPPLPFSVSLLLILSPTIFKIENPNGRRHMAIHGFLFHHSSYQGI